MSFLPVPRSFNAEEALATIGEKLCVELSQCLSLHGSSPFTADRMSTLRGQVSATVQPGNTVRKLMGKISAKYNDNDYSPASSMWLTLCFRSTMISSPVLSDSRLQSYLLASLESSQHKTPPPLPGGLLPVSKELKELAVRFSRLVNFNKLVFSPFYQKILHKLLTGGESP